MERSVKPRVKICCIASVAEARLAIGYGASALGLVARMPSGPGPIADPLIREIAASVPPAVATFLLTCETEPDAIVSHWERTRTTAIQLVDAVAPGAHAEVRAALPHVKLVQVVHVADETAVAQAREAAPRVDAILLDSGNPRLPVKELGGTGRCHDWTVSRRIVESIDRPVFLAGGLRSTNVGEAIRAVRPFGVDVCSGVRTEGRLDEEKLAAFFSLAL